MKIKYNGQKDIPVYRTVKGPGINRLGKIINIRVFVIKRIRIFFYVFLNITKNYLRIRLCTIIPLLIIIFWSKIAEIGLNCIAIFFIINQFNTLSVNISYLY